LKYFFEAADKLGWSFLNAKPLVIDGM
jgi:hypothetical protein